MSLPQGPYTKRQSGGRAYFSPSETTTHSNVPSFSTYRKESKPRPSCCDRVYYTLRGHLIGWFGSTLLFCKNSVKKIDKGSSSLLTKIVGAVAVFLVSSFCLWGLIYLRSSPSSRIFGSYTNPFSRDAVSSIYDGENQQRTEGELRPIVHVSQNTSFIENCTIQYLNRTSNRVISSTNMHLFLNYNHAEWNRMVPKDDALLIQAHLQQPLHKNTVCSSSVDSGFIQNNNAYRFIIGIRKLHDKNNTPDDADHPYLTSVNTDKYLFIISPFHSLSNRTIDGHPVTSNSTRQRKIQETATHCQSLRSVPTPKNRDTQLKPVPSMLHNYENHIIVHYFTLDHTIEHISLFGEQAVCVQHYVRIYEGIWTCSSSQYVQDRQVIQPVDA